MGAAARWGDINRGNHTQVVVESAVKFTHDRIKVAIPIEIYKGGFAKIPDINAIEGVRGAGLLGIGGGGATPGVSVVVESAVKFTHERIQVIIPIQIREGGGAGIPDINAIEGVCAAGLCGVDAGGGGEVVVGNGDLDGSDGQPIKTSIGAGDGGGNYSLVGSFADRVIGCG